MAPQRKTARRRRKIWEPLFCAPEACEKFSDQFFIFVRPNFHFGDNAVCLNTIFDCTQPLLFWVCLPCQQNYWEYKMSWQLHKRKIYLHFTQLRSSLIWQWHALISVYIVSDFLPRSYKKCNLKFIYFYALELFRYVYYPDVHYHTKIAICSWSGQ